MRRRGLRSVDFDEAVCAAIDSLPEAIWAKLADIPITIEGSGPSGVAGCYVNFPAHIVLYEKWITEHVPPNETLAECVEGVLLHEVGHALGMDHDALKRCSV